MKEPDMTDKNLQKELLGNHPERIIKWVHECLVGRVTTGVDGKKKITWVTYPVRDQPNKQEK